MIETILTLVLLLAGAGLIIAGVGITFGLGPALLASGILCFAAGHGLRRVIPNG